MEKTNQQTENQVNQVAGQEVTFFIPNTESIGQLKNFEPKFKLTMNYKSADDWAALKDKPVRAFYMGLKDIPNENGEMIICGVFTSESEVFLCGQKVIVDAVRNLPPTTTKAKTPVEITYKGKKANKSTDGSTMLFDVEILG
jgi:hypothetical protein